MKLRDKLNAAVMVAIPIILLAAGAASAENASKNRVENYRAHLLTQAEECLANPDAGDTDFFAVMRRLQEIKKAKWYEEMDDILRGPLQECVQHIQGDERIWSADDGKYLTAAVIAERKAERQTARDLEQLKREAQEAAAEKAQRRRNAERANTKELYTRVYTACQELPFTEAYTNKLCVDVFDEVGVPDFENPYD